MLLTAWAAKSSAAFDRILLSVMLLHHKQALSEGSAALGQLPRDVRQQVEAHRKAGGVQHLLDLLRQIQVKGVGQFGSERCI